MTDQTDNRAAVSKFIGEIKGFALARTLMSVLELGLVSALSQESMSWTDLREKMGVTESPISDAIIDLLLNSGAVVGDIDHLALGATLRAVVPMEDSLRSWNYEMLLYYESMVDLTERLKDGSSADTALSEFWAYKHASGRKKLDIERTQKYSRIMDESQAQLSRYVAGACDWSIYSDVIDFGGGMGRLALELARENPGLRVTVADLPAVCALAREPIIREGLGDRVSCLPIDLLEDELPAESADAVIFSRVIHDWGDAEALRLLEKARSCLRPEGRVLIVEPIRPQTELDLSSSVSSLMLALMGGRRRSTADYRNMLEAAQLRLESAIELGLSSYQLLTARRASPGLAMAAH